MSENWLTRDLPGSFFENAGQHSEEEVGTLLSEIPEEYQELAFTIIYLSLECTPEMRRCQNFRQILFMVYDDLKKKKNTDLKLPHYWYADGVMIPPEYIVRITNGIIGWVCDDSVERCLMEGKCRYYRRS
jgi:hypothetical protein